MIRLPLCSSFAVLGRAMFLKYACTSWELRGIQISSGIGPAWRRCRTSTSSKKLRPFFYLVWPIIIMLFKSQTSIDSEVYDMQSRELIKILVAPHFSDWAIKGANYFLGIFKLFKRLLVWSSAVRLIVLRVISFPPWKDWSRSVVQRSFKREMT